MRKYEHILDRSMKFKERLNQPDVPEDLRELALEVYQATLDGLTGFQRSEALDKMVDDLYKQNVPFSVAEIDFRNLGGLNDYTDLGHPGANELLEEVFKERLGPAIHEIGGEICRTGGDEFYIVAPEVASERLSENISQAIEAINNEVINSEKYEQYNLATLAHPKHNGMPLGVGLDYGCADSSIANDRSTLLKITDKNLSASKLDWAMEVSEKELASKGVFWELGENGKTFSVQNELETPKLKVIELDSLSAAKYEQPLNIINAKEMSMQTSPAQIDSPEKLQQYAKQHGLFIPENVMSNMQEHLASGQINYADLGQFVQKLSAEKNISTEEKNIFKQATLSAADVNSERTLMEYAKQLKIDIPEQTKALMVQDIRKQNTTPSKLANYLEGVSYERYLQSSDVPYLSEARHASIRQELGDNGYKKYTESVSSMAIKLGVTENAIDHLADKYLTDKVNGLQYINKSLPELNAPALHSESASIMQYSKHIGLPIDENKADILAENQLSKPQIKNMLIDDYFSQHAQSHEYRLSNQKTIEKRSDFELEM